MKLLTVLAVLFFSSTVFAQHADCSTHSFTISGAVKQERVVSIATLDSFTAVDIPDISITNHKGEQRSVAKGMKGVLLKELLNDLDYGVTPKLLSEFYFVFTACDGYKVVYSWNELFNNATGNAVYLVTEKDKVKSSEMKESILLVTVPDFTTGRRYVKGLQSVKVLRAE